MPLLRFSSPAAAFKTLLFVVFPVTHHKLFYLAIGRAVKIAKTSKIIGSGIPKNTFDLCLLDDIWMGWGFQVNFMYDPVL